MKLKKLLAAVLVAVMVLSTCLTGCSKSSSDTGSSNGDTSNTEDTSEAAPSSESSSNLNATGFPIVNDSITVSVMGCKHPIHGEWSEMVFFQKMEEMTGIHLEFDTPALEVFEEKKTLALNGGTYPEVFYGAMLTTDQQVKYGSQGILIPLEGYLEEYCPNLTAILNEYPEVKKTITAPDGHIYALPQYTTAPIAMCGAGWVNAKWLSAMGLTDADLPTDTDGFYDLLTKMKNSDANGNGQADEIPLSFGDDANKGISLFTYLLPAFGVPSYSFYVDDNGKVQYGLMQDNAKEFFKYVSKLWDEGLIDKDSLSQGSADLTAKGAANNIGIAFGAIPTLFFGTMDNETAATYPVLPALSSNVSSEPMIQQQSSGIVQGTFAITDRCENVEAMLRWVDYIYSEEGSLLVHYGPEGLAYQVESDDSFSQIMPTDGRSYEEQRGGSITPDCGIPGPKFVRATTEGRWNDPLQKARVQQVDDKLWKYARLPMPDIFFTTDEQSELEILSTDLKMYVFEYSAKYMTGEASIDDYSSFTDGLKKMKIDRMLEIYQNAYDRWKNS